MRWPNSLSPEAFLGKFWQKQSLLLPASIDIDIPELDANEIAWLATLPDVESRLVFTDRTGTRTSYRLEHGPFSESELSALPDSDWTLLVQDVDKHLPDFRRYFDLVPFIPAWRIDDLMVSLAAPGGSVGPHKDNYDVFLCQGSGQRNWSVSDNKALAADVTTKALDLLEPFEGTTQTVCKHGDVLYLPPGTPHWGVANNLCTTYSIGMRAPTKADLAAGYSRLYEAGAETSGEIDLAGIEVFYADPDLQLAEASQGQIAYDSVRRMREQALLDDACDDEIMMTVLGSVVTDPKPWLDPDAAHPEEVEAVLRGESALPVHGMARVTWCNTAGVQLVFVNGSGRWIPEGGCELVRQLCQDRFVTNETIRDFCVRPGGPEFINWLLAHGVLDTR